MCGLSIFLLRYQSTLGAVAEGFNSSFNSSSVMSRVGMVIARPFELIDPPGLSSLLPPCNGTLAPWLFGFPRNKFHSSVTRSLRTSSEELLQTTRSTKTPSSRRYSSENFRASFTSALFRMWSPILRYFFTYL